MIKTELVCLAQANYADQRNRKNVTNMARRKRKNKFVLGLGVFVASITFLSIHPLMSKASEPNELEYVETQEPRVIVISEKYNSSVKYLSGVTSKFGTIITEATGETWFVDSGEEFPDNTVVSFIVDTLNTESSEDDVILHVAPQE